MAYMTENSAGPGHISCARIAPGNGWTGVAALSDTAGNRFTVTGWQECLAEPEDLLSSVDEVKKAEGNRIVAARELEIDAQKVSAVLKAQSGASSLREKIIGIRRSRAMRNFRTATELCENGISTALPLAALEQRKNLLVTNSIFITECVRDCKQLYFFVRDDLPGKPHRGLAAKKQLSRQIAEIFAQLHKANLWHRDAKASNLVVQRLSDGNLRVALVDMDGIKRYRAKRTEQRFRGFVKLASTLLYSGEINTTDYLRTFGNYCTLTGIDRSKQKQIFAELGRRAIALRLLNLAKSTMNNKKTNTPDDND